MCSAIPVPIIISGGHGGCLPTSFMPIPNLGKYIYAIGGNETGQRGVFRASNASRYKIAYLRVMRLFWRELAGLGGFVPHWFRATRGLASATNLMPSRAAVIGGNFPLGGWHRDKFAGTIVGCTDYRGIATTPLT